MPGAMFLAACLAATAGCGAAGPDRTARTIRVANTGAADFDDLPSMAAHTALAARGYVIEETRFRETAQAAEALARGDADIASGAVPLYWSAAARGAPIRLVAEHVGNMHRLVGPAEAAGCAGLHDGPLAVQSTGAASDVLTRAWLDATCPGQAIQIIRLPQSDSRLAALLSGAVRGAALKVVDAVRLGRMAPGRFTELADFSASFPNVMAAGVFANTAWAARHQPQLGDYLEARRVAEDALSDSGALAAQARASLGASADWAAVAAAYVRVQAWRGHRGITTSEVAATLRFFSGHAGLESLSPDLAADLSLQSPAAGSPPQVDR
jgi:hypothetical protein